MNKRFLTILYLCAAITIFVMKTGSARGNTGGIIPTNHNGLVSAGDSAATRVIVMGIINTVIKSSSSFSISAVSDLYAPNAVVADEEPPFSWNGPTAGAQWISAIEKTCKELKIKELKGKAGKVNVYLQTDESIYVVVPATYSAEVKGEPFTEDGAFTFIFRLVSDKWVIKSQVWTTKRGM